jgi:DNA polymerase-3 subunit chi
MPEVLFYHLQRQPLEKVLPVLLEKTLERGWRAVVQCGSRERAEALDAHLWTYAEDSFLPHGLAGEARAADQPILLTADAANPSSAPVCFLVEALPLPQDAMAYERIVFLFDGNDPDAVDAARARWKEAKAQGMTVAYRQQDERGAWVERA